MTPWQWWAGNADDVDAEGSYALGEFSSRDDAIAAANREWPAGTRFYVVEARSSEDMRYEGAEIVPFVRQRNQEELVTGPRPVPPRRCDTNIVAAELGECLACGAANGEICRSPK